MDIFKPIEIKTFKQTNFFESSRPCPQYSSQFQCAICGFINHDFVLVYIHQMGCALELKNNQQQNSQILIEGSQKQKVHSQQNSRMSSSQNYILRKHKKIQDQNRVPLTKQKFDMMKHLGFQSFTTKYNPAYRKKGGYKCKFCECYFHSKTTVISHQNNCHFLQLQQMASFVVIIRAEDSQKQSFHEIWFTPFADKGIYKYYKCNHCTYVNKEQFRLYQHIQKFCSFNLQNSSGQAKIFVQKKQQKRGQRSIKLQRLEEEKNSKEQNNILIDEAPFRFEDAEKQMWLVD